MSTRDAAYTAAAMVSLLLFDVDGTLITAFGAGLQSLKEAFSLVFARADVVDAFSPHWFAGRNDLWIFREVALRAGISAHDYERGYATLEAAYLTRLRENMKTWKDGRVLPGVRKLLDTLSSPVPGKDAARPVDLGLVTGNLEAGARIKLAAFGLDHYFPSGGYGGDAVDRAEIARIARQRFQRRLDRPIPAEEVALVGDTIHDVRAAASCGYRSVAVSSGTTPAEELAAAGPDLLLPDLSDPAPLLKLMGLAA